jgi:hypothetical protein
MVGLIELCNSSDGGLTTRISRKVSFTRKYAWQTAIIQTAHIIQLWETRFYLLQFAGSYTFNKELPKSQTDKE